MATQTSTTLDRHKDRNDNAKHIRVNDILTPKKVLYSHFD
jgi:hypothetical protein